MFGPVKSSVGSGVTDCVLCGRWVPRMIHKPVISALTGLTTVTFCLINPQTYILSSCLKQKGAKAKPSWRSYCLEVGLGIISVIYSDKVLMITKSLIVLMFCESTIHTILR